MNRVVFTRSTILATALVAGITSASHAIDYDDTITFDTDPVLAASQTPGAWYPDRYAPAGFDRFSLGGDDRLRLSIDGDNGVVGRGAPYNSTFYNTHGRKLDLPAGAYAVKADIYVPADWVTPTARRRSDLWVTGVDAAGAGTFYPIIGVANIDGTPVIRYWDLTTGWVTTAAPATGDTWYTFGISLEGGSVIYTINGSVIATVAAPSGANRFKDAIIQGYNFNDPALLPIQQSSEDYAAYWDNLAYATANIVNTTTGNGYAAVQAAIDAAADGNVIEIKSGTYDGTVLVNKDNLTLKAKAGQSTRPRIEASAPGGALGTVMIASGADGAVIQGLEIIGIDGTPALEKAALYFQGTHAGATISGNTITANGDGAILTEYGAVNSGIVITGNLINGATFNAPVAGSGPGGQFSEPNWPRPAIYMSSGSSPFTHSGIVFSGNIVTTTTGDSVNGNLAVNLDGNGVTVEDNEFLSNTGTKPGQSLLRVRGTNTTVEGNTFGGTADVALIVGTAAVDTAATSTVTGNVFSGTFAGTKVWNVSASALNATHNFWGDASLPSSPSDFTGNIATVPYYTDEELTTLDGPVHNVTDNLYFATISAALAAASTDAGDVIEVDAGTYSESSLTISKAVTIKGPNAGITGTGARSAEARLSNTTLTVTAAATLDGIEVFQTNDASNAVLLYPGSTLQNSIVKRQGVNTGIVARGIVTTSGTGITISGNLVTGDASGGLFGGHKSWHSGIYSNGSGTITGNTIENCRSAINLDDFSAAVSLTGNTFQNDGTYLSFGGTVPTLGSHVIGGNSFAYNYSLAPAANPSLVNNSNVAASFRVDVTGNTFGGVATTALTDAQKFALEARMFHRGRNSRNGVVDFVAGEQIVVSGTTIASAIGAASAGNTVRVGPGTFTEDVVLNKAVTFKGTGAGSTTLVGPMGASANSTVQIATPNAKVEGFTITREGNNATDWNNPGLNSAGISIQGDLPGNVISNNEITGMRTAIDINNSNGQTVRNNVIHNNHTGLIFRNQTDNLTVEENAITGNRTVGILFLDASGGDNDPIQTAAACNFRNNNISGNWYGQVVDRQAGGTLPPAGSNPKNFEKNWLGNANPVVSTANSAEPGYASLIPVAFGGAATAPGGQPDIAGPGSANIDYKPFLSIGTDTDVETVSGRGTYGFQGNQSSLWDGTTSSETITGPVSYPSYFIPTGTTVTVSPTGSLTVGELELAPGATLVVNGGELVIGTDTKISGNFTIFNSFGSWDINGNTTFEIGQSLALISDIHVAPGVTLTVNGGGELVLDGCVIDSQTPGSSYNIVAAANGLLTIARSIVTDAVIDINTVNASVTANKKSKVYDSSFTNSEIEASAAAGVYHNLFDAATASASPGPFADVDGWGNVTSINDARNRFSLEFAAPVPSLVGRTIDAQGNLFVQSNDQVVIDMNVADLDPDGITSAEALLGYNSGLLDPIGSPTVVAPEANWDVVVETEPTGTPGLGLVDSALGLELSFGDDSVTADSKIASVTFNAVAPGATVGFFRVQTNGVFDGNGQLLKDTRLTKFTAPSTFSLLSPFTSNTGELVIDDLDPAIATPAVSGTQVQPSAGSINVLLPTTNYVLRNGTSVTLTFTAADSGLSGLDAADAASDLVLTATDGTTVLNSSNYTVSASELSGVVTYTVNLTVPVTATTGEYDISATVRDRSGNVSPSAALGSFQVANETLATVQLEGFTGVLPGPTTRTVTFVATGGGTATWTKAVSFNTSGIGTVALEAVPAGTTAISAKAAWNLRRKLPVSFSPTGVSTTAFSGSNLLKAGDITGDNVINTLDFSLLRFHFGSLVSAVPASAVADVNGDGTINSGDFNVLQTNFYTVGDPQ